MNIHTYFCSEWIMKARSILVWKLTTKIFNFSLLYPKKLPIDRRCLATHWHGELLKSVVHLYQGSLSLDLRELPNAENEIKVGACNQWSANPGLNSAA